MTQSQRAQLLTVLDGVPAGVPPDRSGDVAAVRKAMELALRETADRLQADDEWLDDAITRWRLLSAAGRTDVVFGRLVEGHVDALVILAEAGRTPSPDRTYGVWASASGRTGLTAAATEQGWVLDGRARFCSGANLLDRALVTARTSDGALLLVDIDLTDDGLQPVPDTWQAVGMDASDSGDVQCSGVRVSAADIVGAPGWYLDRRGFPLGGIGVAAVWWGAARGLYDSALAGLSAFTPDAHQLAHLGALGTGFACTAALFGETAAALPELDTEGVSRRALLCRNAVDALVGDVCTRVPRITGPVPASHDAAVAHRLADLPVYMRQHHAERDLAELGRHLLGGSDDSR